MAFLNDTLLDIAKRFGRLPTYFLDCGVIKINGHEIKREFWHCVRPKLGTVIDFCVAPQGGGGERSGEGRGSKAGSILAIVASVALMFVTAGVAGGALAPIFGAAFEAGALGAKLAAAAIGAVGSLAISALTPPPTGGNGIGASTQEKRDKGAASADGNVLQPGAPMPRVIGTFKVFPPQIAQPLVDLVGDDEVVEAVYALAGPHALSDVRIGDTNIEEAEDVEFELREGWLGDDDLTLVNRYGRTVAPQLEMSAHDVNEDNQNWLDDQFQPEKASPIWHRAKTRKAPDEVWIDLNFPEGLYNRNSVSTVYRVPIRFRIRRQGQTSWVNLPEVHFKSNEIGQQRLSVRLLFGDALDTYQAAAQTGFVAAFKTAPSDVGAPYTGGWTADSYFSGTGQNWLISGNEAASGVKNTVLLYNGVHFYLDTAVFPKDYYEIEVIRGCAFKDGSFDEELYEYSENARDFFGYYQSGSTFVIPESRNGLAEKLYFTRLASVWNESPTPEKGLSLVAVKAKNRSIDSLSVLASGYVKDWDGSGWNTWTITSNPAPHYVDVLSGGYNADPLPDDLRDDDALVEWRSHCAAQGYECNTITEGALINDLLDTIASCGFAKRYNADVFGVIRDYDRSNEIPVQSFNPRNINGFSFSKAFPKLPDGFRINYRDKDNNYENPPDPVIVYREGVSSGAYLEQVSYDGLVTHAAVQERASFDLRQLELRNAFYSFRASADSVVCRRGDMIAVQHDVIDNYAGFARTNFVEYNSAGKVTKLHLDSQIRVMNEPEIQDIVAIEDIEAIEDVGIQTGIAVRNTDNVITIHEVANDTGDADIIELTTPVFNDRIAVDCLVSSGQVGTETGRFIVTGIEYHQNFEAEISCVEEAPSLWL